MMSVIDRDGVRNNIVRNNIVSLSSYTNKKHPQSKVKIVHQDRSNVEKSQNKFVKVYDFESKMSDFIVQLNTIAHELTQTSLQFAPGKESGDDMEKLTEKVNNIERDVAILIERTKNIDNLPSREEVKNIATTAIENKSKDLASKSDVDLAVTKARNVQIIWTLGAFVGIAGLIIRLV